MSTPPDSNSSNPMVVHGYKAISENPLRESCL